MVPKEGYWEADGVDVPIIGLQINEIDGGV